MPYIDTELIESKYLLYPLKNIETNKESINTEQSLKDELLYIEKVEKENKLSPKKDFYTYPKDDKNFYLVAWPSKYEEDYVAYKKGLLTGLKEELRKTYKNGW